MTTETAQRRLLEALADMQRQDQALGHGTDQLTRMAADIRAAGRLPLVAAFPQIVTYYEALAALFEAVRDDLAPTHDRSR